MKRKILLLLLTAATFLTSIIGGTFSAFAADPAMEKAGLHLKEGATDGVLLSFRTSVEDNDFNPGFVVHKADGQEYPAYCINPNKPGIKNVGAYDVDISEAINDPKVIGAIVNGYPFKSPDELGVSTEYQAYYATAIAIWTLVHDTYSDVNEWAAYGEHNEPVYAAMKSIRAKAETHTGGAVSSGTIIAEAVETVAETDGIDDSYLSQTFTVKSETGFKAEIDGNAPNGTKITDTQNNDKTTFAKNESFKVLIPVLKQKQSGNFNLKLTAIGANDGLAVLWGKSSDPDRQDYAVVSKGVETTAAATATYLEETAAPPPPGGDPDPAPNPEEPDVPYIILRKVAYGTTNGLPGAVFRVTDADGGIVGDYITDGSGQVTVMLDDYGAHYVEEITPPTGYLLDENNHKDFVVRKGEENILTFANQPTSEILVNKVDADTGAKLSGAVVRIAYDGGHEFVNIELATGTAALSDLRPGTYTVKEIVAPSGYLLDSTAHSIKVEPGKSAEITLTNSRKPGLIIRKYDEATGLPLDGAEFSVRRKGGQIVYEGITPKSGEIFIEGLEPDWYEIVELAAPDGYLIAAESKTVELEPGKVLEVKFDNRKRPSLEILKIDEATGQPLAGAKFRVTKTEDNTVSEYVTNASGVITINNLDEAIYSVEEIVAPDGYIIETRHKDIMLEWGKTKTVIFTNKKRPVLEIQKIDSVTGEPLAGAKFRVTKTEDKTVSEYITGADGKIVIEKLDEAVYTVEEIAAPEGYILEPQHKEIALEWGKVKTLVYENTRKPTLIITKINAMTFKPIPNTAYLIQYEAENGGVATLGTYRTDSNGQIVIPKANPGWYIITETKAAPGYSLAKNPVTRVYLSPGENAYIPGGLTAGKETEEKIADNSGVKATNGNVGAETSKTEVKATSGFEYMSSEVASALQAQAGSVVPLDAEIGNYPLNSIVIRKTDAITGQLLPGARFKLFRMTEEISGSGGTLIGEYTTDNSGIIIITGLEPGGYFIVEDKPPANYLLSENSTRQAWLKPDGTTIAEITFANYPYGSILISKVDALTGEPLADAKFRVTDNGGAVVGDNSYVTNKNGEILIPNVKPGSYIITEIEAPENYAIDATPQAVVVGTDGKTYKASFQNQPSSTLVIKKYDDATNEPLAGAEFLVKTAGGEVVGNSNGIYTTDKSGTIQIPGLGKQTVVVQEIKAPSGYILENQTQTIELDYGKTHTLSFYNKLKSGLQIIKIDADTKQPLKGAEFTVYKKNGEVLGNYVTDKDGLIIIDELEAGWYKAVETKAPDGYQIDDTPQDFEAKHNQFIKLTFENKKLTSLVIKKINAITGEPLAGAQFKVEKQDGRHIGEYTTDKQGLITIPALEPDWYVIRETAAPAGYHLNETPKTVEVKTVDPTVVTFSNKPLSGIEIIKLDGHSFAPLPGAAFIVERDNGERVGQFKTDATGKILVTGLDEGTYIVSETMAPSGYILDEQPKTVIVRSDKLTAVEFFNKPLSGLQIKKIDSETHQPVPDAEFMVMQMDGLPIGRFKTDSAGLIYLPELPSGWYVVTETKAADGYILDSYPHNVYIEWGDPVTLEIENTPYSGMVILKTDSQTKKPLQGVKFMVERWDGYRIGVFATDKNGKIYLNNLPADDYFVYETEALDGYELDTTAYEVRVRPGKQETIEIQNTPMAGLRILKVDSITGQGIYNVEFMVFDENKNVVGTYYTDSNGVIDFAGILPSGRYTIRETRAAPGYYLDEVPKTIEFVSGKMTELRWENTPNQGQIQIYKTSGDDNEMNGLPAGTPLANAVFEVYDYKTGNMADRFVSGDNGMAVSKPLPLGRYIVKEVKAPQYYKLSDKQLDITIEFSAQIIKQEFKNYSVNLGVSINKSGNREAMGGNVIPYTINTVRNDSTVALSNFYWRDTIPTNGARLTQIVTGSYNQSLRYKIMVTTNKGGSMVIADNLSTTKNNVVECGNAALGLGKDEYVTSFSLVFGNVKAGFCSVEKPKVYLKVLNNLPNGFQFANKCDVGGTYGGEWIVGNSTWTTTIYAKNKPLPNTGY